MNENINMRIQIAQAQEEEALQERLIEERLRAPWLNRLERDFSPEEIMRLCGLRDYYQHGGSDREEVLRRWNFMKYLVEQNMIEL